MSTIAVKSRPQSDRPHPNPSNDLLSLIITLFSLYCCFAIVSFLAVTPKSDDAEGEMVSLSRGSISFVATLALAAVLCSVVVDANLVPTTPAASRFGVGKQVGNKTASAEEWMQLMSLIQKYEYLSGEMNSPHEMRFFQQEHSAKSGGPCAAHMEEMCNPCYKLPNPFKPCGDWKATCHKLFCAPLCLRLLWEVKVESAGGSEEFEAEFAEENVQRGLEAYLLAMGCQDLLGCCPKGDMINNWAEQRVYQGLYPKPAAIAACLREVDRDKAKASCAVTVTVQPIEGACDKFVLPLTGETDAHAESAFERAKVTAAEEIPKHKSFRERCEKLQETVSSMAGEMQSAMEEAACACLGCDDSAKCPHRVMYDNIPSALQEFESDIMDYKLDPAEAEGGGEGEGEE